VVGLPQCIPAQALGAAYGDAFLAGHGAGLFKDYRAIGDWVKVIDTVEPSIATNARYEGIYPLYRALYEDSRETVHALARLGAAWKE